MKALDLYASFNSGGIPKRLYWRLMRERFLPIIEYEKLIKENCNLQSITIEGDNAYITTDKGIKLFIDFSQSVSRAEFIMTGSEVEDWNIMMKLIPNNAVIFDIGANVGWVTLNIRHAHPKSKIYSFEPVETTYEWLKKNLSLNGCLEEINTFNMGFYDETKESSIFVTPENEAASLVENKDPFYQTEGYVGQETINSGAQEMPCQLMKLDDFVHEQKLQKLDFIKCDVEGAEKMVFFGAKETLVKYKPAIYTEMLRKHAQRFSYHPNDIILFLQQLNYKCFISMGGGQNFRSLI